MINIDYSRDKLFDELGLRRLRDSYMRDDEVSPQDRFAFVSQAFGSNPEHAQRLYDYSSKHWLSYSTPILSFGRTKNSQPISCYLAYLPDTAEGLVDTLSEINWLSILGGGVGVHIDIRSADDKSTGVMPHLKTHDSCSMAYRQGKTRRGSIASYLNISHPDIIQFLEMRKPTGDPDMRTLNLNHGISIPDKFMQIIERCMFDENANDDWELIQPNTGKVVEVVSAKSLWSSILEIRMHTGEPYLWFIDTANEGLPQYQKDMGLKSHGSNLCSEISLATSVDRTAVCCLSSVNAEYYDDWKDHPLFIADVLEMLDNVLTYFIDTAPDTIKRAKYSAFRERSVGVGLLGFHAYLQKLHIPFESALAKSINIKIFKQIKSQLDAKNKLLAAERGACPDALEAGITDIRCSHVASLAPNASSSIILGNTSPSAEMRSANIYVQDTISGAYTYKNKYLDKFLKTKATLDKLADEWYDEQWVSITAHEGSVQHLDWMSEYDKAVFKTAREADQRWVIEHAADRQPEIDQAQSINLYLRPTVNIKELHWLHYLAWKRKLKSLYYCRSGKMAKAEAVGKKVERIRLEDDIDDSEVHTTSNIGSSKYNSVYVNLDNPGGCLACE